jgi:SAM-dependent methyltransferase
VKKSPQYVDVTETPGDEITEEAASMLVTRYEQAARLAEGKDVLEVACGAGQGLGYLAGRARRVVGGDLTERLLAIAHHRYDGWIPLVRLDAHQLPFAAASFDVVVLHEAIYYLRAAEHFILECRRVLRGGGTLVVTTVNREWTDFNPSPYSHWYPSACELQASLRHGFVNVEVYGAFPASAKTVRDRLISVTKRAAVSLGLVPRTMKGKRLLKRAFLGKLVPVPPVITDNFAPCAPLTILDMGRPHPEFKVLCAFASV